MVRRYDDTFSTTDITSLNRIGTEFGSHATFAINGGDNTQLDFGAGTARRYNSTTGKYESVSWDAITGFQQTAGALAASGPWFYLVWPLSHDGSNLDSSDVVIEIGEEEFYHNTSDTNHYIRLGRPRNVGGVGVAGFSIPLFFGYDRHLLTLGSTRLWGFGLSGSVGDVQVDLTVGALTRLGAGNHFIESLKDIPKVSSPITGVTMLPAYRTDITSSPISTVFGTPTQNLDINNWDDGTGTLNSVGVNKFANHYIVAYLSVNESQVEVQTILHFYGTVEYGSLVLAVAGIGTDIKIPSDSTSGGLILGCFSVESSVADLGAAIAGGTAVLRETNKFGEF